MKTDLKELRAKAEAHKQIGSSGMIANTQVMLELIDRIEKAEEALRFYAECRHYSVQKVYGEIIEFDVDAGPLRDTYDEVLPSEERGAAARAYFAELNAEEET